MPVILKWLVDFWKICAPLVLLVFAAKFRFWLKSDTNMCPEHCTWRPTCVLAHFRKENASNKSCNEKWNTL